MKLIEELSLARGKRKKRHIAGIYLIGAALIGFSWLLWWDYLDIPYGFAGLGLLIAIAVVVFVLHEGLHGILFWLWSKRVKFGYKTTILGPVFYATSPGSYFTRNRMIAIVLAPQVLTLALIVGLYTVPPIDWLRFGLATAAALNLCGGCGDIAGVIFLSKFPRTVLVEDKLDSVAVYAPKETT